MGLILSEISLKITSVTDKWMVRQNCDSI